ncbi:MAG: glycine cleavage system aminomethyltransferase GcvT [Candidatus Marinamargulisbacteria bacterium]
MLKKTALYNLHKELGAKLVDFAGYEMPVWYKNAKEEHFSVRQSVGMFDISHMGLVYFRGSNAADFLQKVCTNDIDKTQPNKIVYTMILNHEGGILDDVMVGFNDRLNAFFMIINASNKDKIMAWFESNGLAEVDVQPCFDTHGLIAIQGPSAQSSLTGLLTIDWDTLGRFQSQQIQIDGADVLVMRTGYTGEDGVELSVPNASLPAVWKLLVDSGVAPCGLAARDSLRIESGLPLYGHELSEDLTPLQTRYQWVLKWDTGFIGEAALVEKQGHTDLITIGLRFSDRCLPRQGYKIKEGGHITSGTFSPMLDAPVAIAMVPKTIQVGQLVTVDIRSREFTAEVVSLPFI